MTLQSFVGASAIAASLLMVASCGNPRQRVDLIDPAGFDTLIDGKATALYTLTNQQGMTAQITNYGGRVVSLWVPDRQGKMADVVTGFRTLDGYHHANEIYFGALIGRYGNRIDSGRFTLDGVEYTLPQNNGVNTLHGGTKGFNDVVWDAHPFTNDAGEQCLELTYVSPDGDQGFPGTLTTTVLYTLTADNALRIDYVAFTDSPTVINLTNHCFFNLHGFSDGDAQSINDHLLQIHGSYFLPTDSGLIPTGEVRAVADSPMDFTTPTVIGERVNDDYEPLLFARGYDHCFVLDRASSESECVAEAGDDGVAINAVGAKCDLFEAAVVVEPTSGRRLRVLTDQPAIQFYGGNFFEGKDVGKYGEAYGFRSSLALETQHYPDSPNHADFPSTVLRPGELYTQHCIYAFDTVE